MKTIVVCVDSMPRFAVKSRLAISPSQMRQSVAVRELAQDSIDGHP